MAGRKYQMSTVCNYLHHKAVTMRRFRAGYNADDLPRNGIYLLFETGEFGHEVERIVRIGTHTGQGNLSKRIHEHLYAKNKDRSIFRKHIGRSLLCRSKDPFIDWWERDMTTKKARQEFGSLIDKKRLNEIEDIVTVYMNNNFSFVVIPIEDKNARLRTEQGMISAISQCTDCLPSEGWLGNHHPNFAIRDSGLWNIQGLDGQPIEIESLNIL